MGVRVPPSVVVAENGVLPVEVKAGAAGKLRSLHQFLARGGGRTGIRLSANNLEAIQQKLSGKEIEESKVILKADAMGSL